MNADTATLHADAAQLGMAPSVLEPIVENRRATDHAITEFATGVGFMAQEGNSAADMALLIKGMTEAFNAQANELARLTHKPKLPGWLSASIAGIVVILIGAISTGLVTYGSTQTRITMLENRTQSIDRLNSLDAKVDLLTGTVTRMEARFNEMMDNGKRQPPPQ